MIDGFDKREKATSREEAAKVALVSFVARSGENLKCHDPGRRQRFVALQRLGQAEIGGAPGGSVKLDPCRAVDENQGVEM